MEVIEPMGDVDETDHAHVITTPERERRCARRGRQLEHELMFWSKRQRPGGAPDSSIADQCAAYLAGDYRTHLCDARRQVPAWVHLNPLAHGDIATVVALARHSTWGDSPDACVARLARYTLQKMRDEDAELAEVQTAILIPLELAFVARHGQATTEDVTFARDTSRELLRGVRPISVR